MTIAIWVLPTAIFAALFVVSWGFKPRNVNVFARILAAIVFSLVTFALGIVLVVLALLGTAQSLFQAPDNSPFYC